MYANVEKDHQNERVAIIPLINRDFAPVGSVCHDIGEAVN
jgi:hypothetical protein